MSPESPRPAADPAAPVLHFVVGTRAQLIKMAPVIAEAERRGVPHRRWSTGQHVETVQDMRAEFGIERDWVELSQGGEVGGLGRVLPWMIGVTWRLVRQLRERVRAEPSTRHWVVVHGDTFSTLIGALAGRICGCRVAHVESGLSSGNWRHPFPEELTRRAVFRLMHLALCPGPKPAAHLAGRRGVTVIDTGENTLLDTTRLALDAIAAGRSTGGPPCVVCSIHRFENVFNAGRLSRIVDIVLELADSHEVRFVLHPVTRRQLARHDQMRRLEAHDRVQLVPRMTYLPFIRLCAGARFVVSDGGSNQEELAYLRIPTVLMRDATERDQGLDSGLTLISQLDASKVRDFVAGLPAAPGDRSEPLAEYRDLWPSRQILDALSGAEPG